MHSARPRCTGVALRVSMISILRLATDVVSKVAINCYACIRMAALHALVVAATWGDALHSKTTCYSLIPFFKGGKSLYAPADIRSPSLARQLTGGIYGSASDEPIIDRYSSTYGNLLTVCSKCSSTHASCSSRN